MRRVGKLFSQEFRNKTPITEQLWKQRILENEKRNPKEMATESPQFLIAKSPKESQQIIKLNFTSDPILKKQYSNPYGQIDLGLILEDMDAMAGNVAFIHSDDHNPKTRPLQIVTASVDKIKQLKPLDMNKDITMRGRISWIGKSSLEILVDLSNDNGKLVESTFCMVARDYNTKKSAHVNPLNPETEEEQNAFIQGEKNKERRSLERQKSLCVEPPSEEERLILHDLFTNLKKTQAHILSSKTQYETLEFCQPSHKNLHNTIFGGYLMRKGYSLAFSTAYMFLKEVPEFVSLDEITFVKPVLIGDFLQMKARVVYTNLSNVHVEVVALVLDPNSSETKTTNVFNFKFKGNNVKTVYPETYEEAMRYLSARRHNLEDL